MLMTRRERIADFFGYWTPLVLHFTPIYVVLFSTIGLAYYDFIPGWVASPLILLSWCRGNYHFWHYQAWRSSGPRGRIVNPSGPWSSDAQTTVLWLLFGVFFHLYHVWLRSPLAYRLRKRKERQEQ